MSDYAGDLTPRQAWELLSGNPDAALVDVRTEAEWRFVGIPDATTIGKQPVLIEWVDARGIRNDDFTAQLATSLADRPDHAPVVFLCRSGQRSIAAAIAATSAGIAPAYNVLEGFEGPIDADGHRAGSGWKAVGLPWRQS